MAKRGALAVLGAVPLFEGLSRRHLNHVADIARSVDFMAGAPVVREGDAGDSFFVVAAGEAKVIVGARTIGRILPGDYFGEIALLDGGDRTATIMSKTPMTLLEIKRDPFFRLIRRDPSISLAILKGISRMVRQAERPLRG